MSAERIDTISLDERIAKHTPGLWEMVRDNPGYDQVTMEEIEARCDLLNDPMQICKTVFGILDTRPNILEGDLVDAVVTGLGDVPTRIKISNVVNQMIAGGFIDDTKSAKGLSSNVTR